VDGSVPSVLVSFRNRATTVARSVVITKNRIDEDNPKLSAMIPKMIGDTAPGIAPNEKRIPKARPVEWRGHTSV